MSSIAGSVLERSVREQYSAGAEQRVAELCCPISYDPKLLEVIPREILERDYGCGDPSAHVRPGEAVLDLGSGSGKICFIAAQLAGAAGRVVGVDFNADMLGLARSGIEPVARGLGYRNVQFRRGRIQDLRLDLERLDRWLAAHPAGGVEALIAAEEEAERLRRDEPLVPDASMDLVLSNCVLNLVRPDHKRQLFHEIHRVLKKGGRAAISDIVSDEPVPAHLQADPELWAGCISGALREEEFLEAFAEAGFYGITIAERQDKPWRVVEGIEFRSITVVAHKGKEGPCLERNQAVIYKGPWKRVVDDDGHTLVRGQRMAVCDKTFHIYLSEPYRDQILGVEPYQAVPLEEAGDFNCRKTAVRHPRETKGLDYNLTTDAADASCCEPGCC
jgi:ubiquinone/menaquinone biosynthesis C-methylase UbiE